MNRIAKIALALCLVAALPLKQQAQTPYRPYAAEGIVLDFFEIDNVDFRLYLLYNIHQDGRFSLIPEDENGLFVLTPESEGQESDFIGTFEDFYNNAYADFRLIDKVDLQDLVIQWKASVPPTQFTSITLDIAMRRSTTVNNHCVDSEPFCTSDVITFDAASTSQTADQLEAPGVFDDGCIGSSYNPSWYHMRINTPGQFIIHMEGHDPNNYVDRDIDFCMWGPFDDPVAPCVAQLTANKIIDCNYSASYSEDIYLGYPESQHVHDASHQTINEHMPETGEYYILMICNFSQQPCTISFTKTEGSGPGTTDCGILPGIASNDGPYCVGQDINLTITTQAGATYTWTGPDGYTSNQQNPVITNCTLPMAGTYTCVTAVDGETTTGTTEVVIHPMPIASFSAPAVCEGETTQFTSTSDTDPTGQSIESYSWDFGDGGTATGANASHTYTQAGTYQVTLTTSNGDGLCTDQVTQAVTVNAMPVPTASANPGNVDYNGVATLSADAGAQGNFTYHWEPANMVVSPNSQTTQTVGLIETQVYTVTVTNTEGGCTSATQVTVVMGGSNMTATASADEYEICEGGMTTLHAIAVAGTGSYTYSWSPAGTLSNPNAQSPMAAPPVGSTTYSCHVSDGIIAQDVNVTIVVHPNEEKDIYDTICSNETYPYFGQNLSATGVYPHTLQTIHHCDSLVRLHLQVNPTKADEITLSNSCDVATTEWFGETIRFRHDCDSLLTGVTPQGCLWERTVHVRDMKYTPVPVINSTDEFVEAPHYPITATEFNVNLYTYKASDPNSDYNWIDEQCEWTISKESWRIEPSADNRSCTVYAMEWVEDTIWLCFRAVSECSEAGVVARYWLKPSFYGVGDTEAYPASVDVIPNPNNGHMQLTFNNMSGSITVKVYTLTGILVDNFEVSTTLSGATYDYVGDRLTNGIYFFNISDGKRAVAKKVVINN